VQSMSVHPEHTFQQQVRTCLEALSARLVPVLAELIHHNYPREVVALDFEIFSDGFTSQFPVRAFFLDANHTEYFLFVDGQATYPSPVDPGLLDVEGIYPQELEDELVAASPESDPWDLATVEFLSWFQSCWNQAGGNEFPLAATLAHHDSTKKINLLTGLP